MSHASHTADEYRARDVIEVKRALVSVSDKTGLAELATALHTAGVEIVSTGSTAKMIADAGVPVTEVSELTGFPESLDGRVKTLHPVVHGGLLADLRLAAHEAELSKLGIEPFQMAIVNLYPFVETVRSGAKGDDVVEQIDIGGPAMVRASAKNHANVAVVVDPDDYAEVIAAVASGGTNLKLRTKLAAKAFAHTASYDNAVATWFADNSDSGELLPERIGLSGEREHVLRYGENPHQHAALYVDPLGEGIAQATQLHGKEMSYNNYVDADAALRAAFDFELPAVAIIKHANPCGIAVASEDADDPIAQAHRKAHACDPVSAYGGVIAANRKVTLEMAKTVREIFTEVIIAPAFEPAAVELLEQKKNLRILQLPEHFHRDKLEVKQISGGLLVQEADRFQTTDPAKWELVSGEPADAATMSDLEFAWKAARAVKSNAILLAHNGASVGVGMGQVNRVDSCGLAVSRAGDRAAGSVAASDAFFPFADGLEVLMNAGIKAVVQPGGSIRDAEVIAAAKQAGVTMYLTGGERHFFH